jgi:1-pyrroline-5-carboxylate dehydrogenase
VGIHPFGGFNMSGTDSKAGGKDYLLLFLQPKSIARKKV